MFDLFVFVELGVSIIALARIARSRSIASSRLLRVGLAWLAGLFVASQVGGATLLVVLHGRTGPLDAVAVLFIALGCAVLACGSTAAMWLAEAKRPQAWSLWLQVAFSGPLTVGATLVPMAALPLELRHPVSALALFLLWWAVPLLVWCSRAAPAEA